MKMPVRKTKESRFFIYNIKDNFHNNSRLSNSGLQSEKRILYPDNYLTKMLFHCKIVLGVVFET